ncbi:MAG: energy transducer TonB [candidate division Zixibacteria bacterium]|nr:energy transducer TonB [candidate division Zixibacteria bacterium]
MNRALAMLAGYGAFEIKRAYRKNLSIGMIASSAFFLFVIGGVVLVNKITSKPPEAVGRIVLKTSADLGAPPTLSTKDIPIRVAAPERAMPSVGVPTPVPDEEAPEEVEMATMDDLAAMAAPPPVMDLDDVGDKEIIIEDLEELLPSSDEFVAYDEMPEKIDPVEPAYPEMARRAGIEGVVWVNALIDKEGKVRDVKIIKDSGANAGFEEAAIEAAKQTAWKPAISNGQPIAVWISYKITFTLK